jgi:hypothetical protein
MKTPNRQATVNQVDNPRWRKNGVIERRVNKYAQKLMALAPIEHLHLYLELEAGLQMLPTSYFNITSPPAELSIIF